MNKNYDNKKIENDAIEAKVDPDTISEGIEIPSPLEDNQLQGGDDLDNTSIGSDDGNRTDI